MRYEEFAFCGSHSIHFELYREDLRFRRHQTVRRIPARRIGDSRHNARVNIAILLREIRAVRQRDLNDARLDASQLPADQTHDRLLRKTLSDFIRKRGITRWSHHDIYVSRAGNTCKGTSKNAYHFNAWSKLEESSSMIHSTTDSGRLPFFNRSSWN